MFQLFGLKHDPTDQGVIPETSRTNKTEHFFMNIFHIEGLHKVLHSVFIYLFKCNTSAKSVTPVQKV